MPEPARKLRSSLAALAAALLLTSAAAQTRADAEEVDYAKRIKPLLARHCFRCHGSLKQESELRLDAIQLIQAGGATGEPLLGGQDKQSLLVGVVTGDAGFRMPPEGEPLSASEIDLIKKWIEQGAKAPDQETVPKDPRQHWAFQPPKRPAVPQPKNTDWVRSPVDAFIAARHDQSGLTPQAPPPKQALLRRVSLDLTGLPPTPEELRAFLADDSPDAYERVVDRLLESPQYGERWGRHWMDVWRYADWYGYGQELRNSARHIWRWRDWIVESLNEDKSYDRMIVEMLAADESSPGDSDALRATGFLARNYYKFNRNTWLDSTVEHTSKAFLGITLNCARCHDHMYDPIAQREYYAFRAIFEPYEVRTDPLPGELDPMKDGLALAFDAKLEAPTYLFQRGNDKAPDKEHPLAPAAPAVLGGALEIAAVNLPQDMAYPGLRKYVRDGMLAAARADLDMHAQALASAQKTLTPQPAASVAAPAPQAAADSAAAARLGVCEKEAAAAGKRLATLEARIAADNARYAQPPADNAASLAQAADQAEREARLLTAEAEVARAEFEVASAAAVADEAKKKDAAAETARKLEEARKKLEEARAADKADGAYEPLTPVYPQTSTGRRLALAHWIANEHNPLTARVAVHHIWMRHFGKPLVPTVFDFGLNGKPPTHPELLDWLAVELMEHGWSQKHLHRLIVLSSAYRMDSALEVAGSNNTTIDPDNSLLWRMNPHRMESEAVRDSVLAVTGRLDATMGGPELDAELGQTTYRRSLYYRHAPEKYMTFLKLFDSASSQECYRRNETVVPQQALALVNSPLSIEQSRRLAQSLTRDVGSADDEATCDAFIDALFERVLCRPPEKNERAACKQFLISQSSRLNDAASLTSFSSEKELSVAPAADPHLRARENLAHVLLNHNEFVSIR